MNPFVSRIAPRNDRWIWPISAMSLVVGFMFSIVWVTDKNRVSRYPFLEPTQKTRVSEATIDIDAFNQMRSEVNRLQAENTKLQNGLAKGNESSKLLNEDLQDAKRVAALTPLQGPGIVVTLRDSSHAGLKVNDQTIYTPDKNIHDLDVLRIVNELFACGAEAVSVNHIRIGAASSIRCVGPTILINDAKIASPVNIEAIGDPKTLAGGLNLNGGVLSEIRSSDPDMISIEEERQLNLDPFTGRTRFRFAKVPKAAK